MTYLLSRLVKAAQFVRRLFAPARAFIRRHRAFSSELMEQQETIQRFARECERQRFELAAADRMVTRLDRKCQDVEASWQAAKGYARQLEQDNERLRFAVDAQDEAFFGHGSSA